MNENEYVISNLATKLANLSIETAFKDASINNLKAQLEQCQAELSELRLSGATPNHNAIQGEIE